MKMSFSLRLTLWYSAILFAALIAFGLLSYYFVSYQFHLEEYAVLAEDAEQISEVLRLDHQHLDLEYLKSEVSELNLSENGVFFEVWDSTPTLFYRSINFPLNLQTPPPQVEKNEQTELKEPTGPNFHLYGTAVNVFGSGGGERQTFYIRTGQSTVYVDRILGKIRLLLMLLAPLMLLVAGVSGWYLTRRALNPILEIISTTRDISMHDLKRRLPKARRGDELGELVETLNAMIDRIENGVRNIQRFTADASHELRTPMTAMRGEIEVALRRTRSVDEYQKVLKSSLQELQWMEKMVNDLLLLSRADAGQLALKKQKTDLRELCGECLEAQKYAAQKKGIGLQMVLLETPLFCRVDSDRIRQVLCNLLDNAIKYTPAGGDVHLLAEKHDSWILVTISDTGIGISDVDLKLVFNRFYRADKSRSREQYSSGLGLAICRWIVEAHGGKIEIQSALNRGTTVQVVLPE